MQVDAASFPLHLLGLFINISEADFVSFDLELSGIPSRLPNKQRRPGRLTLEDRYAETKQGADRYQILQVGITCARFDYTANKYILRPYNINLSPLLSERLDFEREISFQSGACSFLLDHGFDLGAPFATGVQYLSREEAAQAKQMAYDRIDKKNPVEDLQLKDEDVDSLDFVRRAREAINKWKKSKRADNDHGSLEITTHTGLSSQSSIPVISRFEKRLVHQLVRAEFQDCVAIGRQNCIRIVPFDAAREADNTRRLKQRVKDQIFRQTGFRWIFEALARGDIDRRNPPFIARSSAGMDGQDRFDRALERLKSTQAVLVGHNMFTDIVYLYRTFVGELPDTLAEFCDVIHELFPKIIDTKYLATHAGGDLNASPSLEEIAKDLQNQPLPSIATDADHSEYQDTEAFHEAGYDSLLTATIMLRLAAKLGAERKTTTERPLSETNTNAVSEPTHDFIRDGREKVEEPVPIPPAEPTFTKATKSKKNKKRSQSTKSTSATPARFQTANVFDSLRTLTLDDSSESELDHNAAEWGEEPNAPAGSWQDEVYVQDESGWVPIQTTQRKAMELIPGFDDAFWDEFGNKLRVFGTQEAVLRIAGWKDK